MSRESAAALVERMKTDPVMRDRVLAAQSGAERSELLGAEGYDCSRDDLAGLAQALTAPSAQGMANYIKKPTCDHCY